MKKYLLSLGVILAFAFYITLAQQGATDIVGQGTAPPATTTANPQTYNSLFQTVKRDIEDEFEDDDNGPRRVASTAMPAPGVQSPIPARPPAPTPAATSAPIASGQYKNGVYTGPVTDAFYGPMQVEAVIQGGKLANVTVLQYPNDRGTSRQINDAALPILVQEAIQAQSANVNIVSGATQSSEAFAQSLQAALAKAKV